jgi:hypothetical protein
MVRPCGVGIIPELAGELTAVLVDDPQIFADHGAFAAVVWPGA